MKHVLLATALLAACASAAAQQSVEVPKAKCEPVPVMPGRNLMGDKMVRRNFENDLKAYKECMNAYLDQRKAVISANTEAANASINEFNSVMKKLNEAAGTEGGDAAPKTDSYKK